MFATTDRPATDKNGREAHYEPTVGNVSSERGVLVYSSNGQPAFPWQRVKSSLGIASPRLNYVGYFIRKIFDDSKLKQIKSCLEAVFSQAYPNKDLAAIFVYEGKSNGVQGTYVSFSTPYDNVPASNIVATAAFWNWTADGNPLGRPWHIGFETTEMLQAVKLSDIPSERRDHFAKALSQYFEERFDPLRGIKLVALWENQSRTWAGSEWQSDGTMLALICVQAPLPGDGFLHNITPTWPGWLHWEEEHLIRIDYSGRFDFCEKCKHTAQDMGGRGPAQRHTTDKCSYLVCGVCGHRGHNSKLSGSDKRLATNKRACEEGKEERRKAKARRLEQEALERAAQQETAQAETELDDVERNDVQEQEQNEVQDQEEEPEQQEQGKDQEEEQEEDREEAEVEGNVKTEPTV